MAALAHFPDSACLGLWLRRVHVRQGGRAEGVIITFGPLSRFTLVLVGFLGTRSSVNLQLYRLHALIGPFGRAGADFEYGVVGHVFATHTPCLFTRRVLMPHSRGHVVRANPLARGL